MSYLVIARKWRPQTFEDVVGQPHVTRTLQNAIRSNRIAHAYLFTGARGVGKTSIARILAKTLNCLKQAPSAPCNECSNCREITQGNSVDVLEIDGASNRGIDNIRELRETVRYRPAKGKYKIYIIDEVHMLTTEAFNALLKTLEEPPEHVLFIFATTEPHKIPATILSRCQRFDFRRIPTQQLASHLRNIVTREGGKLSDVVLYAIAREADGSMRDAQSLLEQLLAFSGDGLSDEEVLDVLGVVDRRSVHRVGQAILSGDVRSCIEVVGDLYRRGIDSRRFCQQLCDHFRNLLFVSLGNVDGNTPLDLPDEERKLLEEEAARTTSESLQVYFQMILKGEEEIRRSSLPRTTLEMLLLRLTQLPRLQSLDGLLEKLAVLESRLSRGADHIVSEPTPVLARGGQAPGGRLQAPGISGPSSHQLDRAPAPGNAPQAREPELRSPAAVGEGSTGIVPPARFPLNEAEIREDLRQMPPFAGETCAEPFDGRQMGSEAPLVGSTSADVVEKWPRFLNWLEGRDPVLAAKLKQSSVTQVAEGALQLEVLEMFENGLKDAQGVAKLSAAASGFFGQPFQWTVRASSRSAQAETREAHKPKGAPKVNPRRMVLEHPLVLHAIEVLGGELVDIKRLGEERPEHVRKGANTIGKRGLAPREGFE